MKFKEWLELEDEQKFQYDIEAMSNIVLEFVEENKNRENRDQDCLDSNERIKLYLLIVRIVTAATMEAPDNVDKKIYLHTLCSILSQPLAIPCSFENMKCQKYYDRCIGALEVLEANIESFNILLNEMNQVFVPDSKIILQ